MPNSPPLDYLPLWALIAVIAAAIFGFIELGFRLGRQRCKSSVAEAAAPLGQFSARFMALGVHAGLFVQPCSLPF